MSFRDKPVGKIHIVLSDGISLAQLWANAAVPKRCAGDSLRAIPDFVGPD